MSTTALRASMAAHAEPQAGALSVRDAARALAARAPFRSPETPRGHEQAGLHGRLPDWLRGQLVRVTPSFGATPKWAPAHWFDALGMVFGFELNGGDRLDLRWATLDCAHASAAASGKLDLASFASPNQRGRLARLLQPIPAMTDNANVNVVRMGDDWVALTETPHQLVLDPLSLQVRGRVRYEDDLGDRIMLAHPIPHAGGLTNVAYTFGPTNEVILYEQSSRSRTRMVRGRWKTRELPYIHSIGLSERTAVVIDHPFRVQSLRMLWSNRGMIEHFRWRPETGTRLVMIDRATGRVQLRETDALFCFHTVHCFETPDATVLDLLAYPDPSLIDMAALPQFAYRYPKADVRLVRLSIDRRTGRVSRRELSDVPFELPQVDWGFARGAEQAWVHGVVVRQRDDALESEIVRVSTATGEVQRYPGGDYVFGEPVFVGAPGRSREGDGVLLAVGSCERGSALFVLDATTLEPLAHAEFGTPLPLGFHGNFLRADGS